MLRSLMLTLSFVSITACGDSGVESAQALSTNYVLKFPRDEALLRSRDIRESTLVLATDGTFHQVCIDAVGARTEITGMWHTNSDWISFDRFLDCSGAWPAIDSISGANLHFRIRPRPEIVVEPDLGVLYIAGAS